MVGSTIWPQSLTYYSRLIVGWSLGTRHVTELMVEALMDAVVHYRPALVLHNDRGSEYLSQKYLLLCASLEITPSASAAGKPWENGFQESFYDKFKLELGDVKRFENDGELLEAIALQLHYYNTKRRHTSIKNTPLDHMQNYETKTGPNQSPTPEPVPEPTQKQKPAANNLTTGVIHSL